MGRPGRRRAGRTRQQITHQVQSGRRRAYLFDDLVNPLATAPAVVDPALRRLDPGPADRGPASSLRPPPSTSWPDGMADPTVATTRRSPPGCSSPSRSASRCPSCGIPSAVLATGVIVASIPTEPKFRLVPLGVVAVIGLSVIGLLRDVPYWYLTTSLMVLVFLGAEFSYREHRAQRVETDRRYDELIDRARMFVWEIDERSGDIISITGNVDAVLGYERSGTRGPELERDRRSHHQRPSAARRPPGDRTTLDGPGHPPRRSHGHPAGDDRHQPSPRRDPRHLDRRHRTGRGHRRPTTRGRARLPHRHEEPGRTRTRVGPGPACRRTVGRAGRPSSPCSSSTSIGSRR